MRTAPVPSKRGTNVNILPQQRRGGESEEPFRLRMRLSRRSRTVCSLLAAYFQSLSQKVIGTEAQLMHSTASE